MRRNSDYTSWTVHTNSSQAPETWVAFPENIRVDMSVQPLAGVTEPLWCSTPEFCVFRNSFDFEPPPAA